MSFAISFLIFIVFAVNGISEVFSISLIKGSDVQLFCPLKVIGGATLQWSIMASANIPTVYTNNERISHGLSPELRQRLSITGDHTIGEYHLTISNITESDQGSYRCNIVSTSNTIITDLIVIGINGVSAISAVKGSTVQLLCPYRVNGGTTLQWTMMVSANVATIYSNNDRLTPNLSPKLRQRLSISGDHTKGKYHLTISDIMESDQGRYRCSILPTLDVTVTDLIVIVDPTDISFQNMTPDNKISGIEGQDINIKCTAVGGQPPPYIKLEILGSTYTGTQLAQHKFKPVSANDGSNVTCQAGYEDINHYPLTTTAYIHLKLKPVITALSPNTLSTEEKQSFDVTCESTGSRPAATIYWLLGQQQFNVTLNSTVKFIHDSSTDTYNVTSNLEYIVDRIYNAKTLTCGAVNIAGSIETSLTLDIKYAPGVIVDNRTLSLTQSPRQIQSTIDSNPPVSNCKWHHRSKYGEYIRNFSANKQVLTLPTVPEDEVYQDTGEYICTAENGIVGINGQLKQNGSGYVISNAPPVITADNKDNSTQYGKFGESTKIYVDVYSIPKYSRISWYKGNAQLVSNKYAIKDEPALVKDVFHGVEVQLDGYRITLIISDLQDTDFTNYTLRLYDSSQYVEFKVTLEFASAPDTPSNFSITSSGETSISVQWISGYDGGHTQIFFIEYRISGTDTWTSQNVRTSNKFNTYNDYTLSELQDKTTYELRMYAENRFNQSQRTDIQTATTMKTDAPASSVSIIGGVGGVIVVLLIACVVTISLVILKRRKGTKVAEKNAVYYENPCVKEEQTGEEYEEVANQRVVQHKQCSKTYESLCAKDVECTFNVYDELHNSEGKASSKFPGDNYEALSDQDTPTLYDELDNR